MQFTFHPDGAEKRTWPFEPGKMTSTDAEDIEDATGLTFDEWNDRVQRGSVKALRALLWVLLRREPGQGLMQLHQITFSMDEVDFELDDDETLAADDQMQKVIAEGGILTPQQKLAAEKLHRDAEEIRARLNAVPVTPTRSTPADDQPLGFGDTYEVAGDGPKATPTSYASGGGRSLTSSGSHRSTSAD